MGDSGIKGLKQEPETLEVGPRARAQPSNTNLPSLPHSFSKITPKTGRKDPENFTVIQRRRLLFTCANLVNHTFPSYTSSFLEKRGEPKNLESLSNGPKETKGDSRA